MIISYLLWPPLARKRVWCTWAQSLGLREISMHQTDCRSVALPMLAVCKDRLPMQSCWSFRSKKKQNLQPFIQSDPSLACLSALNNGMRTEDSVRINQTLFLARLRSWRRSRIRVVQSKQHMPLWWLFIVLCNVYYIISCINIVYPVLYVLCIVCMLCYFQSGNYIVLLISWITTWWQHGMASIRLETPELFDFKNPDGEVSIFEQFWQASGLSKESEICQVSTLLYYMSQDADNSLPLQIFQMTTGKITKQLWTSSKNSSKFGKTQFMNERDSTAGTSVKENPQSSMLRYCMNKWKIVSMVTCEMKCYEIDWSLALRTRNYLKSCKWMQTWHLKSQINIGQKEAVQEQHVHMHDGSRDNPIVVEGVHSNKPQSQSAGASQEISYKPRPGRGSPSYKPQPGRANQCTRCGCHKHSTTERCPARGV